VVNTVTPQMWATFTHEREVAVNADFQYANLDGTPLGVEAVDSAEISSRVSAWIPDEVLEDGGSYKWRVRARSADNTVSGSYSDWCEFTVRATLVREADSTVDEEYTPPSDAIPDVAIPQEELGPDEPIPGLDDEPPFTPAPDTGEPVEETEGDESDIPADAFAVRSLGDSTDDESVPSSPQSDDQATDVTPPCPFDLTDVPADGSAGAPVNVPDGQYICAAPDDTEAAVPDEATAAANDARQLDFGSNEVDTEVGPDTPEAFQAEQEGSTQMLLAAAKTTAPGDLGHTPLPSQCSALSSNRWHVSRYDACYWRKGVWEFTSIHNGVPRWDATLRFNEYRYARQSPKRGTWDYHIYLRVTGLTHRLGVRLGEVRAYPISSFCRSASCKAKLHGSSGSMARIGNWIQFSATFTPNLKYARDKRVQHTGFIKFSIYRVGGLYSTQAMTESNWVRCDQALKGTSSVGCVVPNFIPSLRYSRNGRYPSLANHIYAAQQSGLSGKPGGHLDGEPGSDRALTRLYDDTKRGLNGDKACPRRYRARVGAPTTTSCDEYPFRSTYQGAHTGDPNNNRPRTFRFCHIPNVPQRTGRLGYSRCFIKASENSQGGNWVGRFYGTGDGGMRILDNDKFYVRVS
jgi:hypothetical protein